MNYFKRGLIPGPDETKETFLARVESCPLSDVSLPEWARALDQIEHLFGVRPDWIEVQEKSSSLSFWEAAATFQTDKGPLIIIPSEKRRKILQKLVSFQEVCTHEMVHGIRGFFEEPRFEEILAYQTSHKAWRRYLGSLWKRPSEMRLFLFLLIFSVGIQALEVFFLIPFYLMALSALPWLFLGYALVRLLRDYSVFKRCKNNLKTLTENPLAVMLGLTDYEIALFAKKDSAFIRSYREKNQIELRWTILPLFNA